MADSASILVAEDDDLTRELLEKVMSLAGHRVVSAADGAQALAFLKQQSFDLVLSDIQMVGASGIELLEYVNTTTPDTPVVLITAYADADAAMDAIARGAADYLGKPVDVAALRVTVTRALERRRLKLDSQHSSLDSPPKKELLGTSPVMIELYKQIAQAALSEATVLITGESGSGKELVARTIHSRSPRAKGPWVPVNCAAFSENLLESELFGHERGAFTGAHTSHRGLFEEANGGTIFLDEVADVPAKMQAQLLRALQEGEIRRVGSAIPHQVDVRVIAATNRDLAVEVSEKRMRSDLYYRLDVFNLHVPALRERGDDILTLARHFAAQRASAIGRAVPGISPEALERLRSYPWPGNVRELENVIARAVAVSQGNSVIPSDLPARIAGDSSSPDAVSIDADWPTLQELEHRYIERVLARTEGNKTAAASILGIDRRTLQRLFAREGAGENGE